MREADDDLLYAPGDTSSLAPCVYAHPKWARRALQRGTVHVMRCRRASVRGPRLGG
jgi:hypothetical protein